MAVSRRASNPKSMRFRPGLGSYATIGELDETGEFQMHAIGLILNESFGGCGLVVIEAEFFEMGKFCFVQIPPVGPLKAEIVWIKKLDSDVQKIGFRFTDEKSQQNV